MHVRPLRREDRSDVERLLASTGMFTTVEIAIALELVDAAITGGEASGYSIFVLDTSSDPATREVHGYVCFGPTPLTEGTYDLYWIAVERSAQGRGYGRTLLEFVEHAVRERAGRLLLIETSSQDAYGGTIRFYERNGYPLIARIPDFYRPRDDKLVFAKKL